MFTVPGDENGITLTGLADGQYRLTEVKAPDGYIIRTTAPVQFMVLDGDITGTEGTATDVTYVPASQEDEGATGSSTAGSAATLASFTVPNTPGSSLPNTGGSGTAQTSLLGALLSACAIAFILLRPIRQRR